VLSGVAAELPATPVGVVNRDGEEVAPPTVPRVVLGPAPVYYHLV
jgi:hypothetical protein